MKKLLLSILACFAMLTANAWTVYFTNPDGWTNVNIWAWVNGGDGQDMMGTGWPGQAMTNNNGTWTYTQSDANGTPDYIIFNNGNGTQTGNLTFSEGATYNKTGIVGAKTYEHTVYFSNTDNWSAVYVYAWGGSAPTGAWPGDQLSANSEGLYVWTVETDSEATPTFDGFIFNDGVGTNDGGYQTDDLTNYVENAVYNANGQIVDGDVTVTPAPVPSDLYILGNIQGNEWNPANTPAFTKTADGVFEISDVTLTGSPAYFCFTNILTDDWDMINSGNYRYGPATDGAAFNVEGTNSFQLVGDASWTIAGGTYTFVVDFNNMTVKATGEASAPYEPGPVESAVIYLVGDMQGWDINGTNYPLPMVETGVYEATFTFGALSNQYFRFYSELGSWDQDTYGPYEADGTNLPVEFSNNVFSSDMVYGKGSWFIENFDGGDIKFTVNFNNMTVTMGIGEAAGISGINSDNTGEAVIYNLQGVRVNNPSNGLYIINGKKVLVK